jgi:cholesterol transport system auxiliary component
MSWKVHTGMLVSAFALTAFLVSCGHMTRVSDEKRQWVLEATRPGASATSQREAILLVPRFRVSDLYSGKSFVYRKGEYEYESDYYNAFFASTGSLVSTAACAWISRSGLFKEVLCSSSRLEPTYVLEGEVLSVYGDFRPRASPSAALEIRCTLITPDSDPPGIVFRHTYQDRIPLESADPQALTAGWNRALERILESLEKDLASLPK